MEQHIIQLVQQEKEIDFAKLSLRIWDGKYIGFGQQIGLKDPHTEGEKLLFYINEAINKYKESDIIKKNDKNKRN